MNSPKEECGPRYRVTINVYPLRSTRETSVTFVKSLGGSNSVLPQTSMYPQ